eukprot:EG_transcript_10128
MQVEREYGEAFHQLFQKSHDMMHSVVAAIVREWTTLLLKKEKELEETAVRKEAELISQFQERELKLQEWELNLRQRENALQGKMNNSKRIAQAAQDKVCLNVGGTEFLTTKETLLSEKDTFFHAMLFSGMWKPDDQGKFFIDRDPRYFADVLNYLRLGQLHVDIEHMSEDDRESIFEELDFYQLQKALEMLGKRIPPVYGLVRFDPTRCTRSIVVSTDRSHASYFPESPNQWAAVHLDVPLGDCSFSFTSESHHFIIVSHDFASLDFPLWPRNLQCFLAGYGTHWTPHTIVPQQNIYTVTIKAGKFWISGCGLPLPMHGVDLLFFFKQYATSVSILPERCVAEEVPTTEEVEDEAESMPFREVG